MTFASKRAAEKAQSRFFHRYDAGYRYAIELNERATGWIVAVCSAAGHFLTFV